MKQKNTKLWHRNCELKRYDFSFSNGLLEKGKPLERVGRKAAGPTSHRASQDRPKTLSLSIRAKCDRG
jgi:hypothetical protein